MGGYRLQTFMAGFSGFPILVEGSESGTLDVAEDLSMKMVVESTISPDAVGFPLPIVVELAGGTVPQIDPSHFVLEAEGLWNEEEVYVGWDCFLDAGLRRHDDTRAKAGRFGLRLRPGTIGHWAD